VNMLTLTDILDGNLFHLSDALKRINPASSVIVINPARAAVRRSVYVVICKYKRKL
jgi:hypothetical protein